MTYIDFQSNTQSIKDEIINTYSKELPAIKHISEETAKNINDLNIKNGHPLTIKEIKELHNEIGKKLENFAGSNEFEKFKTLNEVIDDIKHAKLTFKEEQAHEKH